MLANLKKLHLDNFNKLYKDIIYIVLISFIL